MGALATIKNSVKIAKIFVSKHSPEILVTVGLIGMGAAIVLVSSETVKAADILEDHKDRVEGLDKEVCNDKAEIKAANKDTVIALAKTYWPGVLVFAGSTACILAGFGILRKRYAASVAAYTALNQAYELYRERIREKYGDEADDYGLYGVEYEEISVKNEETGKKEKRMQPVISDGRLASPYSAFYAPYDWRFHTGSVYYRGDDVYDKGYLMSVEADLRGDYEAGKLVTLIDLYKRLGLDLDAAKEKLGDKLFTTVWWKGHEPKDDPDYIPQFAFIVRDSNGEIEAFKNKADEGYGPEEEYTVYIINPQGMITI